MSVDIGEFLAMGGYGRYVWPAWVPYSISVRLAVLPATVTLAVVLSVVAVAAVTVGAAAAAAA